MTTRMYHPTVPAWHDVSDDKVGEWAELGWKQSRPSDFPTDDDKQIEVGQGNTTPSVVADDDQLLTMPDGNDSTEDWKRYAIQQGATLDELQDMSRNEIRDVYNPSAASDDGTD